jgi:hypothetical protein
MRILVTVIFCFVISDLFSQKIDCGKVTGISFEKAYNKIENNGLHTLNEARCLGGKIAKDDRKKGIKRILRTLDFFETPCFKCIYYKYGFETYYIGAGDIIDEKRDAFIDSYNRVMESDLTEKQKLEIHKALNKSTGIFSFILTTKNIIKIESVNDTILNVKMYSDSLENLFKSDSENILVEFSNKIQDGETIRINYCKLKNEGINIPVKFIIDNKLYIDYNFSRISNNYDICWCEILDKKYGLILPVKLE